MPGVPRLREILRQLRDPERGCPWDLEQTFESIAPYTIEEAYEVDAAVRRRDWPELCDELGDLLLQVVYHSQMADEAGHFGFDDVVEAICAKLVRRHPHVFEGAPGATAQEVSASWEERKARERAASDSDPLDVPTSLPALMRAAKLWARSAAHDLDPEGPPAPLAGEVGSLGPDELARLLALCARQLARLGVDPEAALRRENAVLEERLRASLARRSSS